MLQGGVDGREHMRWVNDCAVAVTAIGRAQDRLSSSGAVLVMT